MAFTSRAAAQTNPNQNTNRVAPVVQATTGTHPPAPAEPALPTDTISRTDLTSLVQSIQAMTPTRKVLYSEFKSRSPFNPSGKRSRKLTRTYFQNGARLNVALLLDEEIKLLGLLQPGHYIGKLVTVRVSEGSAGALDVVRIEYPNKTHDQRMVLASKVQSFVSLLQQVVAESQSPAFAPA